MILAFAFVTGQRFTPLFHYWSGEQVSVMVYKKLFEKMLGLRASMVISKCTI